MRFVAAVRRGSSRLAKLLIYHSKENGMTTLSKVTEPHSGACGALKALDWLALVLLIIGGVNWGLPGLFGFDGVAAIFGTMMVGSRVIYTLVGLAALYAIYMAFRLGGSARL